MNTSTKGQRQVVTPLLFLAVCVLALNNLPLGSAAKAFRSAAMFNPQYDAIGRAFTQQYYPLIDNSDTRGDLATLYHPTDSLMSFDGNQFQGATKIVEHLKSLSSIKHSISAVDSQPMFDGGVLVTVSGQFKADEEPIVKFSQTFVLKQSPEGSFFAQHDIFRSEP